MANYVANCKISGPRAIQSTADVDFNGLQWSYRVGLMFPPTAAQALMPMKVPPSSTEYAPRTQ